MTPKVTAWSSWAEWQLVYEQLTSPDLARRALGVCRVQTWRSRARLPVAVDVTASFVEAMLHDPELNTSTATPRSDHELQMLYSMCIIRLVNGIVDHAQRRATASSISMLTQELDWPQWFVDLRHEATHRQLPSLHLLRIAAKEAVWLLFERFWRPQQEQLDRRGRGWASHRGRLATKIPRVRDSRLIDRRLKLLVKLASQGADCAKEVSAAGGWAEKHPVEEATDEADEELAVAAAKDLAGLAADEGRLLDRVLRVVLAGEPSSDGREAWAVHLLCAASSDNFALRLAREVLTRALGWPVVPVDPAPDSTPSLRNICDARLEASADGTAATPSAQMRSHLAGAPTNGDSAAVAPEEADRMLCWLEALLEVALGAGRRRVPTRSTGSLVGQSSGLPPGELRLVATLRSLAPWLRRRAVARIAAAASTDGRVAAQLAQRAARVWQAVDARSADAGGHLFKAVCAGVASGPPAAEAGGREEVVPGGLAGEAGVKGRLTDAQPSLDEMEAFVQDRKKQRLSENLKIHEPWTAVGTLLDPESLQVRSWLDPTRVSDLPEDAAALWRAWAAGGISGHEAAPPVEEAAPLDAPESEADGAAGPGSQAVAASATEVAAVAEHVAERPVELAAEPEAVAEAAATAEAAEARQSAFRDHAAALLEGLRPFDIA